MKTKGDNFTIMEIGPLQNLLNRDSKGTEGKYFIGNEMGLTGCEISLNCLPAGKGTAFVHSHKKNEEIYIVIGGNGTYYVDGTEWPIQEGSLVRVSPAGERAWQAGDKDLYFICIQAQEGSLTQATLEDGILLGTKTSWMKS